MEYSDWQLPLLSRLSHMTEGRRQKARRRSSQEWGAAGQIPQGISAACWAAMPDCCLILSCQWAPDWPLPSPTSSPLSQETDHDSHLDHKHWAKSTGHSQGTKCSAKCLPWIISLDPYSNPLSTHFTVREADAQRGKDDNSKWKKIEIIRILLWKRFSETFSESFYHL